MKGRTFGVASGQILIQREDIDNGTLSQSCCKSVKKPKIRTGYQKWSVPLPYSEKVPLDPEIETRQRGCHEKRPSRQIHKPSKYSREQSHSPNSFEVRFMMGTRAISKEASSILM